MESPVLVLTDADNTLWDTDAVYADAQLAMLHEVAELAGAKPPLGDKLALVRRLDQAIAHVDVKGLRYPPALLAEAIARELGSTLPKPALADLEAEFLRRIRGTVPQLRLGVPTGLHRLCDARASVWVYTEGELPRCERLLSDHRLRGHVDGVISGVKTASFYLTLAEHCGPGVRVRFCIGDQLDRDVQFAKEAQFRTIHFPSAFRPAWTEGIAIAPDYTVSSFLDAAQIVVAESTRLRSPTLAMAPPTRRQ